MFIHAQYGFRGKVIDLDTNQRVPKVIWLDTDRGMLEAYQVDEQENIKTDLNGDYLTFQAKGRFKYVAAEGPIRYVHDDRGAPICARCGSKLTLPRQELCAFCNALDKGTKKFRIEPIDPLLVVGCQHPGCNRQATRQVGDEVECGSEASELSYEIPGFAQNRVGRLLFDRGAIVDRRWWCDWHYQPPRILDPKGEVIEVLEDKRTISA